MANDKTKASEMTKRAPAWLRPGLLYIGVPLAAVVVSTGVVLADWSADVTDAFKPGPISSQKVQKLLATLRNDIDAGPKFIGFSGSVASFNFPAKVTKIDGYTSEFSSPLDAFSPGAGTFKAPKTGYYRFSVGGFAFAASAPSTDTSITFYFIQDDGTANGKVVGLGGGQLSAGNSPLPSVTKSLHLNQGDTISLKVGCTQALVLGDSDGYGFRFEGEFLGQ